MTAHAEQRFYREGRKVAVMNYITNFTEARDEARRLTKVLGRDVEAKAINCDCDYSRDCFICGGSGIWYDLVFAFCDHSVGDGEQVECEAGGCSEREREAVDLEGVDPFPRIAAPLQSCAHVQIERDEQEAA